MNTFFVTGLPRSRTAWLANLLTHGPAFCYHERLGQCRRPADLLYHFSLAQGYGDYQFIGDSDSIIPLVAKEIIAAFPDARWVICWRDMQEAIDSYMDYFAAHRYAGQHQPKLDEVTKQFTALCELLGELPRLLRPKQYLEVTFQSLSNQNVQQAIWEHCTHCTPFDAHRARLLETLNINVAPEKVSFLASGSATVPVANERVPRENSEPLDRDGLACDRDGRAPLPVPT